NLIDNYSLAEIADGVVIFTTGATEVSTLNDTDGKAVADASATNSQINVGVAVAIQDIKYKNIATVSGARITAASLSVIGNTVGADLIIQVENLRQSLLDTIDDKAGMATLAAQTGLDEYNLAATDI